MRYGRRTHDLGAERHDLRHVQKLIVIVMWGEYARRSCWQKLWCISKERQDAHIAFDEGVALVGEMLPVCTCKQRLVTACINQTRKQHLIIVCMELNQFSVLFRDPKVDSDSKSTGWLHWRRAIPNGVIERERLSKSNQHSAVLAMWHPRSDTACHVFFSFIVHVVLLKITQRGTISYIKGRSKTSRFWL